MTIDTTPGTGNSFASVGEFKVYAAFRVPVIPWYLTATDDLIADRLIFNTIVLGGSFVWTGAATTDAQVQPWPRSGMLYRTGRSVPDDVYPLDLKYALSELTLQSGAKDLLADNLALQAGVSHVKAGSVEVDFQTVNSATAEAVDLAIRRMGPDFLAVSNTIPGAVRMLLVPSWYKMPKVRKFAFKSV